MAREIQKERMVSQNTCGTIHQRNWRRKALGRRRTIFTARRMGMQRPQAPPDLLGETKALPLHEPSQTEQLQLEKKNACNVDNVGGGGNRRGAGRGGSFCGFASGEPLAGRRAPVGDACGQCAGVVSAGLSRGVVPEPHGVASGVAGACGAGAGSSSAGAFAAAAGVSALEAASTAS